MQMMGEHCQALLEPSNRRNSHLPARRPLSGVRDRKTKPLVWMHSRYNRVNQTDHEKFKTTFVSPEFAASDARP